MRMEILEKPGKDVIADVSIPSVTQKTLHVEYHHAILSRFYDLYAAVEREPMDDHKEDKVTAFLACAQYRYAKYLRLLDKVGEAMNADSEPGQMEILPPWDVAICFHVHCLSPFRFMKDMISHGANKNLWQTGIKFPVERLYELIQTEQWSDPESEAAWRKHYPESSYQLWASDPTITEEHIKLESISETSEFSLDLVAASLRQRVFTTRIIHECYGIDCPSGLQKAITRYHRFMLLMKTKNKIIGKYIPLVPTLDIDLAWHTHQLFPQIYREFCLEFVGREVNHNDIFDKVTIGSGLRATSLAWLDAYNEPYTPSDMRKTYFTRSRVAIGILFPPYGIMMIRIGRKLKRAQTASNTGSMRHNGKCGGHVCNSTCSSNCGSSCGGSGGG